MAPFGFGLVVAVGVDVECSDERFIVVDVDEVFDLDDADLGCDVSAPDLDELAAAIGCPPDGGRPPDEVVTLGM